MKRLFSCLLCLLLLGAPVFAQGEPSLDEQVRALMEEYGLNADNFALHYFNHTTGESYSFNPDAFFPVGRVWTLPLHMYYFKQEALGAFEVELGMPEYTISGMTLEKCRFESIQNGDEAVAQNMRDELGDFRQYQLLVNEAFGHCDTENLPNAFYADACYSAEFLMNCLKAISSQPEYFGNLMRSYQLVQKADGVASYGGTAQLVHIRGEADGMLCDVGEVSVAQPFLLVCFVREDAGGDAVLAELMTLLCEYSQGDVQTAVSAPTQRSDSDFYVAARSDNSLLLRWIGISLGAAAGAALLVTVAVVLLRRRRK